MADHSCLEGVDGDLDGWPDDPCGVDDADQTFETPYGWGYAGNFFPDLDGDGLDEVVVAGVWLFTGYGASTEPYTRSLFMSRSWCASGGTQSSESAAAVVRSSAPMRDFDAFGGERWYELIPLGDLDGDGLSEAAVLDTPDGVNGVIVVHAGAAIAAGGALDADDAVGWMEEPPGETATWLMDIAPVGDIDGDGAPELLAGGAFPELVSSAEVLGGVVALGSHAGDRLDGRPADGSPFDYDGDGVSDVVWEAYSGVLLWSGADSLADGLSEDTADATISRVDTMGSWDSGAFRVTPDDGDGYGGLVVAGYQAGTVEGVASYFRGGDLAGELSAFDGWFRVESDPDDSTFRLTCASNGGNIYLESANERIEPYGHTEALQMFGRSRVLAGGMYTSVDGPDAVLSVDAGSCIDASGDGKVLMADPHAGQDFAFYLLLPE